MDSTWTIVRRIPLPLLVAGLTIGALALILVLLRPGGDGGYLTEVQLTDADDGAAVKLLRDGALIVALSSNRTTGFGWQVREPAPTGLDLVDGPRYAPPGSTEPVVGAPGTEVFTFKAVDSGTHQLVLEYRRSFEPGVAPAKTFTVTADVR